MSGGKAGKTPKLPHHFMTIHYAICHGVIDSINQIEIKGKQVFCGRIVEDGVVYVNMPDLFGGEEKEGGPYGVIETYRGGPEQLMSNRVASRFGRTSETMVGYRGIANLFFRGPDLFESSILSPGGSKYYASNPEGGYSPPVADANVFSRIRALLFNAAATVADPEGGFKWIVNNPYLPKPRVSVTRIGRALSNEFAAVYPIEGTEEGHIALGNFDMGNLGNEVSTYFPLAGDALTRVQAGGATATVTYARYVKSLFTVVPTGSIRLDVSIYATDGSGAPLGSAGVGGFLSENGDPLTASLALPEGTRQIRVSASYVTPFAHSTEKIINDLDLTFKMLGEQICSYDGSIGALPDMNPAHIIYETQVDRDWGAGDPPASIDTANYMEVAEALHNEGFGLSMMWQEQSTIGAFQQEVLDHIQATKYIDPDTGLWTLKLIRGDYDVATLPTLDPSNCKIKNLSRMSISETKNEVIVEWTNPKNEKTETVSSQDAGNIAQQNGSVVSVTRPYYGVRNRDLAQRLANRDIRVESSQLLTVDVEADRSFSDLKPGSVVKFTWPEEGINEMVLRVGPVNRGKPGDSTITFRGTEDVFAFSSQTYVSPARSLWVNPARDVGPLDREAVLTAPLPLLLKSGYALSDLSDGDYPKVVNMVFGDGEQVTSITIGAPVVQTNGSVVEKSVGVLDVSRSTALVGVLYPESFSTISGALLAKLSARDELSVGDMLMLGETDAHSELIVLDAYDPENDLWRVGRGLFDTVPRFWPIGSVLWFIGDQLYNLDPSERASGVPGYYKLMPRYPSGALTIADASITEYLPSDRPYAPERPGNITPAFVRTDEPAPYPRSLANGAGAADLPSGWAVSGGVVADSAALVLADGSLLGPRRAIRYFYSSVDGTIEQRISIPAAAFGKIDRGGHHFSLRWWQAGAVLGQGAFRFDVVFYDENESAVGVHTGVETLGAVGDWFPFSEVFEVPASSRSIQVRAVWTQGTDTYGAMVEDVRLSWSSGEDDAVFVFFPDAPETLTLSWSSRNRQEEDTVAVFWDESSVTPESGQTHVVRIYAESDNTLLFESAELLGSGYDISLAEWAHEAPLTIHVAALRDGYESIQSFPISIYFNESGYGYGYGTSYGTA